MTITRSLVWLLVSAVLAPAPAHGQHVEVQSLHPEELEFQDQFGRSVSLDGSWLAVGAPVHKSLLSAEGAVFLYERVEGRFVRRQKLVPRDVPNAYKFGHGVLLRDQELFVHAATGPKYKHAYQGLIHVFRLKDGVWKQTQVLRGKGTQTGSAFGESMAVDGDTLMVGAWHHTPVDRSGLSKGWIYVFERAPNGWEHAQILVPTSVPKFVLFGWTLDLDGNRAVAGTKGLSFDHYVFERVGGVWQEVGCISEPDDPGRYSDSLDLEGDVLAIGTPYDGFFLKPGRVRVYRKVAGQWILEAVLFSEEPFDGDQFGIAVRLRDNRLAVTATNQVHNGDGRGATHLFRYEDGGWREVAKLVDSSRDLPTNELWGKDLDFAGTTVVTSGPVAYDDNQVATGGANVHRWPVGESYCDAVPSSLGWPAVGYAHGSISVTENDLDLWASNLPANVFGYFLASRGRDHVPGAGGGSGTLCLGAPIARFRSQVFHSGPKGAARIPVNLAAIPMDPPVAVRPGETWCFQAWFRDGGDSNFARPTAVTFRR